MRACLVEVVEVFRSLRELQPLGAVRCTNRGGVPLAARAPTSGAVRCTNGGGVPLAARAPTSGGALATKYEP